MGTPAVNAGFDAFKTTLYGSELSEVCDNAIPKDGRCFRKYSTHSGRRLQPLATDSICARWNNGAHGLWGCFFSGCVWRGSYSGGSCSSVLTSYESFSDPM